MSTFSARRCVRLIASTATFLVAASSLAACAGSAKDGAATQAGTASAQGDQSVTILAYDSFDFPQELLDKFHEKTGITAKIQAIGNGGELANQLVLTKDSPLGDAVFGLDNTVSTRIGGQGIIEDAHITSPNADDNFQGEPGLVPIDRGDVCMLVAMNPASSTPGMAFMLATIAKFGPDGYAQYWKSLKDNGVKITEGWSQAFNVDYSAGEGKGSYPMMVSYGSSPAYAVNDAGTESSTGVITDTCFRQVEYAGVLKGAKNPEGAKKFIEFLLSISPCVLILRTLRRTRLLGSRPGKKRLLGDRFSTACA